ncbi:hypothetical protein [Hyphomicrobium sp.]|jgi:hypothetical protein
MMIYRKDKSGAQSQNRLDPTGDGDRMLIVDTGGAKGLFGQKQDTV